MNELVLYGAIGYSLIVVGVVLTACELRRSNAAGGTPLLNGSVGLTNAGGVDIARDRGEVGTVQ